MQFTSWPDYGVPHSAAAMLEFLQRMRDMQSTLVTALGDTWNGHPLGPPIIVHCSAGIGRTGIDLPFSLFTVQVFFLLLLFILMHFYTISRRNIDSGLSLGSLCTIDICLRRLEDVGTIDVHGNSLDLQRWNVADVRWFSPISSALYLSRYCGEDPLATSPLDSNARPIPVLPHCNLGVCRGRWPAQSGRRSVSGGRREQRYGLKQNSFERHVHTIPITIRFWRSSIITSASWCETVKVELATRRTSMFVYFSFKKPSNVFHKCIGHFQPFLSTHLSILTFLFQKNQPTNKQTTIPCILFRQCTSFVYLLTFFIERKLCPCSRWCHHRMKAASVVFNDKLLANLIIICYMTPKTVRCVSLCIYSSFHCSFRCFISII